MKTLVKVNFPVYVTIEHHESISDYELENLTIEQAEKYFKVSTITPEIERGRIMEHPTREEALKELAQNFWWNDENWTNLKDYIFNIEMTDLDPTGHDLYFAAIGIDKLEEYLEKYYDLAEEAGHIRIFKVCKDCYDYITAEDEGMVADIFTHYYGEEEGDIRFLDIKDTVNHQIEKDGKFLREVPELVNTFSRGQCHCCRSTLHGERFYMLFVDNREK